MSLTLTITDEHDSVTYELLEVPFTKVNETGTSDVTVMSGNVYTDYVYRKFRLDHTWAVMTEDEFLKLEGFFNRQFSLYKYPLVSVPELGIDNVPCRMKLGDRKIISNCGLVEKVKISLRETAQL